MLTNWCQTRLCVSLRRTERESLVPRTESRLNLHQYMCTGQEVTDVCKERVLKTMKEFPSSVEVQINCCQVMSNIALRGECDTIKGRQ